MESPENYFLKFEHDSFKKGMEELVNKKRIYWFTYTVPQEEMVEVGVLIVTYQSRILRELSL